MGKNRLIYFLMLSFGIYGIVIRAVAQMNPSIKNITISSPNAAALGKYGDIPVNNHTGIPSINIPIYTIRIGNLELPINMSYHASGLKVQEQASWVGAGWALDGGGVITRTVMGAPDDKGLYGAYTQKGHFADYGYNSYLFSAGPATCDALGGNGPAFCPVGRAGMTPSNAPPQDSYIQCGIFDGEPDLYFFNFNGHSGKFYFNDDRTPVIVPQQDLLITPIYPGNDWRGMTGFIITTSDGTKYYFGKNQDNDGNIDAIEATYNISTQSTFTGQGATSSWYLNKIVSSDGQFIINLIYQAESISYYSLAMYPIPAVPNPNWYAYNNEYDLDKNYVEGVRLKKISFPNGEVNFNPGGLRQDISKGLTGSPSSYNYNGLVDMDNTDAVLGGRSLGDISIQSGTYCKKYSLFTSYFYDSSPLTGTLFTQTYPGTFNLHSDQYRLRLDSIQESTCDNTIKLPPYIFNYNSGTVPRKLSFGIDHWGFYNGVTTNTKLIPTYTIVPQPGQAGTNTSPVTIVQGANRDPSWPAMSGGTLNRIKYPTSGTTTFDFEPHKIYGVSSSYINVPIANMYLHMYGQGGNSTTQTFVVDGSTNSVNISMISTCNFSCTLLITNSGGSVVYNSGLPNWDGFTGSNVNSQNSINLPSGTYTAVLALNYQANNSTVTGSVQTNVSQWQNVTSNASMLVGGLRIKTVTSNDAVTLTNIVTNYGYNYNNVPGGQSSATLYSVPVYVQGLRNDAWAAVNGLSCNPSGCFTCFGSNVSYYQSPSSIRPMSTSQGNHIGYGEVYVSQTNNGYSKYKYYGNNGVITGPWTPLQTDVCQRVLTTFCDPNLPNAPAAPLPFDPMRGELASLSQYSQSGQLIKNSSYYPLWKADSLTTPGLISKFFVTGYTIASGNPATPGNMNDIEIGAPSTSFQPVGVQTFTEYNMQSAKKIRDSVVTETYDQVSGNYATDINATYYGSPYHTEPTQTLTISSRGEKIITNFKNAFDFRIGNFNLIDQLSTYYSNINSDNSYLSYAYGTFTLSPLDPHYYWNRLYIYTNYRYMKAVDRQTYITSRINFLNSYNSAHASAKAAADFELKPLFELQDKYNNPTIETSRWKNNSLHNSLFTHYDYVNNPAGIVYPKNNQSINLPGVVTNFINSSVSTNTLLKDARYKDETSLKFEQGNIVETKGKDGVYTSYIWGHNNTAIIVKAIGVDYSTLKMAYDAAGGNLTLLRNQPSLASSFVNTFFYAPNVGITKETNFRGASLNYEYDGLGRLVLLRDNDGNILKKICYNYAGQPENCNVACTNFSPIWQNTTSPLRCQLGSCGNTGYQEQEQQDINPCSPRYNQTQWVLAGYNPTACAAQTCVTITSTNTAYNLPGYIASYYNTTTGYTYNFTIPATSGLQTLGNIPVGTYNLTISKPGGAVSLVFKSGCKFQTITGSSALFSNISVSSLSCNSISIANDLSN